MAPVFAKRKRTFVSSKRDQEPIPKSKLESQLNNKLKSEGKRTVQGKYQGNAEEPVVESTVESIDKPSCDHIDPPKGPPKGPPHTNIPDQVAKKYEPTNTLVNSISASSKLDFDPSICKPFAKTGRCKYGDECKFMHERIFKQPSPNPSLKTPPPRQTKGCAVCKRDPPVQPVRSECEHDICELCFLDAIRDTPNAKCGICDAYFGTTAQYPE